MSQPGEDPVDSDHFTRSPLQATDGLGRIGLSYPIRLLTRLLLPRLFSGAAAFATYVNPLGVDCHPRTTASHLLNI